MAGRARRLSTAGVAHQFYVASTDDRPVVVKHGHVLDRAERTIDVQREIDGVTDCGVFYGCGEPVEAYLDVVDEATGEVLNTELLDRGPCPTDRWLWDGEELGRFPGPEPGELPEWPDDIYREQYEHHRQRNL